MSGPYGAKPLGAGSKVLMGLDVASVYFCVRSTAEFRTYPFVNLVVEASSEALFARP